MWQTLLTKFEKYPAQAKVLKLLFERGFQVNEEGKVTSGSIEIAHTQLAKEVGVDRRVVDATTKTIVSDELLSTIFKNVHSRLSQNYTRLYIWVRNIEMLIFFKNNYFLKSILFKKLTQVCHHVQKVRSKAAIFTSI